MNGVFRPDLGNMLALGFTAFVLVWGANRVLRWAGKPQWTTSGS